MRIAKELIAISRLIASSYPIMIGDKGKNALDVLREGQKNSSISNVDYKNANSILSREFRIAGNTYSTALEAKYGREVEKLIYLMTDSSVELASLGKHIREWNKWIRKPELPKFWDNHRERNPELPNEVTDNMVRGVKYWIEFLESWQEVPLLKKEVKRYIVKKQRGEGTQKEVYTPPPQSKVSMGKVKKLLEDVIAKKKSALVKYFADWYIERAQRFIQKRKDGESPYKFFNDKSAVNMVRNMVESIDGSKIVTGSDWEKELKLAPGADKLAQDKAAEYVDFMAEQFVYKNLKKLTSIIAEKEKSNVSLTNAQDLGGSISNGGFEGIMLFEFSDGTSFKVNNKIVFVMNWHGTAFNRFPTTFHDVVYPDGKLKRKVSEKEMNTSWVKG